MQIIYRIVSYRIVCREDWSVSWLVGLLVEFDQHAIGRHVVHYVIYTSAHAPFSILVFDDGAHAARSMPPAAIDGAVPKVQTIVSVRSTKLHAVGYVIGESRARFSQGVTGVSAVAVHRQTAIIRIVVVVVVVVVIIVVVVVVVVSAVEVHRQTVIISFVTDGERRIFGPVPQTRNAMNLTTQRTLHNVEEISRVI